MAKVTQQDVNRIAKYIYRNTDGATKMKFGVNQVDVYMFLYYHDSDPNTPVQQMDLDINLTSYDDKIRFNVTEMTHMEKTLLHGTVAAKDLDNQQNLEKIRQTIYDKMIKAVEKEFAEYEIVY